MAYDLVIRNGLVVDGSGKPGVRADVGIAGDRIAEIGRLRERGLAEIDAAGHVVTPGFIDAHTHMDAQLFWDPLGTSSCWHGVTSVVMGNCGFTLAPSTPNEHNLVVSNLERAEDISGAVMAAGITWTWESFPEFLDAVDVQPKAINYSAQIGHSALRTSVMGERAFSEPASEDELALMARTLGDAIRAGAVGFSSSDNDHHRTMDGRPVASVVASHEELVHLVGVLSKEGGGVFQLALAHEEGDDEALKRYYERLAELAISTKVPVTFGLRASALSVQLNTFEVVATEGGEMFGQSRSGAQSIINSFKSEMPYDRLPIWNELRTLPIDAQKRGLRDAELRVRLVAAVDEAYRSGGLTQVVAARVRKEKLPSYEQLVVLRDGKPDQDVASLAAHRGIEPIELIIDLALESDFDQVFGNYTAGGWSDEDLLTAMRHPRSVMTFSDSGAHVGSHSGAELQTCLLATWVRERQEFTLEEAVRMMTLVPAQYWKIPDRGLLRAGMFADINVFDPETVALRAPTIEADLPAGAKRVIQKASGYLATIVSGKQTLDSGEHTGELPGRLVRGRLARAPNRR